ncbi:MAG: hypothetical protein QNL39_07680 [Akkermansiaceae bacterium]|jgi:hypothetical protein|tara:strand:+ start:44816 stop:45253 length:438 start_codon:yes stop_codon:yes gene_type:complete
MDHTVITYVGYIMVAIPLTIWVAKTLHKNGRIFLLKSMKGDEGLADSVNHLLVVGFYLVNLGFVSLYLKLDQEVQQISGVFEALSAKLGVVMLILGGMHFFNIWLFTRMGRRGDDDEYTGVKPPAYAGWSKTDNVEKPQGPIKPY